MLNIIKPVNKIEAFVFFKILVGLRCRNMMQRGKLRNKSHKIVNPIKNRLAHIIFISLF